MCHTLSRVRGCTNKTDVGPALLELTLESLHNELYD